MDFHNLGETARHEISKGEKLRGLCYDDSKLFCVEKSSYCSANWLTVYGINVWDHTLLHTVLLRGAAGCPRADSNTHTVYVPCRWHITVYRWQDGELFHLKTLSCVASAYSVAVGSVDHVFVCDVANRRVCLVNVSTDTVIRWLQRPDQAGSDPPQHVAALDDTVLVCYGRKTLVTYRSDSSNPDRVYEVLQIPKEMGEVTSMTTDGHSSFLVTYEWSDSVFVLDGQGHFYHRIPTDGGEYLRDCAVVNSELWLAYYNPGQIAVMTSSQSPGGIFIDDSYNTLKKATLRRLREHRCSACDTRKERPETRYEK